MTSNVVFPPENIFVPTTRKSVFLAGSIDNGNAPQWQKIVIDQVLGHYPIVIYNPRRKDWDSTLKQEKDNFQFFEQVNWELAALERSDVIAMYFAAGSMSPISLLELGLFAKTNKVIVYCSKDFYRKGNVDIVCQRYGIPVFEDERIWMTAIKTKLELI